MSSRSDVYSFPYVLMLADRLYWNASYTIALSFSKYKTSRKFSTACSHCRNYFLIAVYVVLERTQQVCLVIHLFSFSNCLFFFFFFPLFLLVLCPFVGRVLSQSVCHNWNEITEIPCMVVHLALLAYRNCFSHHLLLLLSSIRDWFTMQLMPLSSLLGHY